MFKSEYDMRQAGAWDESRQTVTTTICPYCGVGCNLELHVQDDRIVNMGPWTINVSHGPLCVKGRFASSPAPGPGVLRMPAYQRLVGRSQAARPRKPDSGHAGTTSITVHV